MSSSIPENQQSAFITPAMIDELQEFRSDGARVLSVYLDTSPGRQPEREFRVVFRNAVQNLREQLDEAEREALEQEAEVVLRWLDEYQPGGQGLVLFSCQPHDFWREHHLPLPVSDEVVFDNTAFVRPLMDLLDEYERYAVALVDRERARLFTVHLAQIEESAAFEDRVSQEHKQEIESTAKRQRHYETHVRSHLKDVVERLSEMAGRRAFDRLILAGPEETTAEFQRLLPQELQSRVVDRISLEMVATAQQVLERTLPLIEQVERTEEEQIVADLLARAPAGAGAMAGLEAVLDMLGQGRVQQLVLAEGFSAPGSACPNCLFTSPREEVTCPGCGQAMEPVTDLAERAVERTLGQSGLVETVHGPAAEALRSAGGIGAFLRW